MENATDRIVIKGVTRDGKTFRPSDWAQRLSTAVATQGPDRRIRFHPRVSMAIIDGYDCVVIDSRLAEEDPLLFEFLLNFARDNRLETG